MVRGFVLFYVVTACNAGRARTFDQGDVGGDRRHNGAYRVERFVESARGVVLAEFDACEERLVVETADGWFGVEVAVVAVLRVLESYMKVTGDVGEAAFHGADLLINAGQLASNPVLFGLEEVERDSVGVVGAEQLSAFGEQPFFLRCEVTLLRFGGFLACGQVSTEVLFDGASLFGGELHVSVEIFDEHLGDVDGDGLLEAVVAFLVASDAHEVRVDTSLAVLGHSDNQAATAAAEDRGLEVMRMLTLFLAAGMLAEDDLDTFPGLRIDQRLMSSWIGNFAVDDVALVVRVAQYGAE